MSVFRADAEAAGDAAPAERFIGGIEIEVTMVRAARRAGRDPEWERRGNEGVELLRGPKVVAER